MPNKTNIQCYPWAWPLQSSHLGSPAWLVHRVLNPSGARYCIRHLCVTDGLWTQSNIPSLSLPFSCGDENWWLVRSFIFVEYFFWTNSWNILLKAITGTAQRLLTTNPIEDFVHFILDPNGSERIKGDSERFLACRVRPSSIISTCPESI
jgi:hypothetical protein